MKNIFQHIRDGDLAQLKIVSEQINYDTLVDERGTTPLILASYHGHLSIVEFLLKKSKNINKQDNSGNTALMGATFKGFKDIVTLLIDSGADVNIRNFQNATALFFAAGFNRPNIARTLIDNGADITLKDNRGKTAYHQAKAQGLGETFLFIKPLE
ncbi:MAG: ankyrin repeat domain-containing protein [Flavobacteriaceae bacterium]|nr:ankyrin repeat domain-containing protein [Flavobacteriaceae bacterium]